MGPRSDFSGRGDDDVDGAPAGAGITEERRTGVELENEFWDARGAPRWAGFVVLVLAVPKPFDISARRVWVIWA